MGIFLFLFVALAIATGHSAAAVVDDRADAGVGGLRGAIRSGTAAINPSGQQRDLQKQKKCKDLKKKKKFKLPESGEKVSCKDIEQESCDLEVKIKKGGKKKMKPVRKLCPQTCGDCDESESD